MKTIVDKAIVLPDGQPIVWVSRLFGTPLAERLAGSDVFPVLIRLLDAENRRVYLVGSHEAVLRQIIDKMSNRRNFLAFAPPFFQMDRRTPIVTRMLRDIRSFSPEFVFVGLGFPKQEMVSLDVMGKLEREGLSLPLFLCVGASLEFFAGEKRRAPFWMQKVGLEWTYRLAQEPRRLWWRYLSTNTIFIGMVLKEIATRINFKSVPAAKDSKEE